MNIRSASFDALGMYRNSEHGFTYQFANYYKYSSNVPVPSYIKTYLNKKNKLNNYQKRNINKCKTIDEINNFFYEQNIKSKIHYNSNVFEIEYIQNDLFIKKKFNISKNNLQTPTNKEFYKLCQFSKQESSILYKLINNEENLELEFKKTINKSKNGKARQVYTLKENNDEIKYSVITKKLNIYLMLLQQKLFKDINSFAYQANRSYKNYLEVHTDSKFVLKLDIADFFMSITKSNLELELNKYIKNEFIVKTLLKFSVVTNSQTASRGHLAQGLSIAPALSNVYLLNFDNILQNFCESKGLYYSRYCDDLIISSKQVYFDYNKIISLVSDELKKMELNLNEQKTKFMDVSKEIGFVIGNIRISDNLYLPNSYFRDMYNTMLNILYNQENNDLEKLFDYYMKYIKIGGKKLNKSKEFEKFKKLYTREKVELEIIKNIRAKLQYAIHINKYDYNLAKCIKKFNEISRLEIIKISPIYNHPIFQKTIILSLNDGSIIPKIILLEKSKPTIALEIDGDKIDQAYLISKGKYIKLDYDSASYCFINKKQYCIDGVSTVAEYSKLEKQINFYYKQEEMISGE